MTAATEALQAQSHAEAARQHGQRVGLGDREEGDVRATIEGAGADVEPGS